MTRELFWLTLTVILTGRDVDALHAQSRSGARPHGRHGQSLAQRQAAVGMGQPHDVRPRQCGREPGHLRAAGADPQCHRLFEPMDRARLRRLLLGAPCARPRLHRSAFRCCARVTWTVGFFAQAALVLAVFKLCRSSPALSSRGSPESSGRTPLASDGGNWPARMLTWIDGISSAGVASVASRAVRSFTNDASSTPSFTCGFLRRCSPTVVSRGVAVAAGRLVVVADEDARRFGQRKQPADSNGKVARRRRRENRRVRCHSPA